MLKLILVLLVIAAIVLTVVLGRMTRLREKEFARRFGSYEEFAAAVDAARIRAVRDEKGPVQAIKTVRTDFPGSSLVDAKRYVDELD